MVLPAFATNRTTALRVDLERVGPLLYIDPCTPETFFCPNIIVVEATSIDGLKVYSYGTTAHA